MAFKVGDRVCIKNYIEDDKLGDDWDSVNASYEIAPFSSGYIALLSPENTPRTKEGYCLDSGNIPSVGVCFDGESFSHGHDLNGVLRYDEKYRGQWVPVSCIEPEAVINDAFLIP